MEKTTPFVEIRLFGTMQAMIGDVPLPRLRSHASSGVLALLALRVGKEVSREWLAAQFWADSAPEQALYNLRRTLTDLRKAFGDAACRIESPSPQTVRLATQSVWVDAAAFEQAADRGDWEEIIALHRNPLLEGWTDEWATQERLVYEQQFLHSLRKLANQAADANAPAAAAGYLCRLVAADPLHEGNQRALMQALANCGDFAAVTQTYRALRLLLDRELQTAPSPETEALYRRLQAQAQMPAFPPSPPAPLQAPNRRLPVPLTPLIGRRQEIEMIRERVCGSRLVTLLGTGGVGKTRLALAVGEESLADFPDGVWFVELAALTQPKLVASAVAKTLGISSQPKRPLPDTLADALADRHLLLILDNCEHLLEPCAALVGSLLAACPRVHILTTSREALHLIGEQCVSILSLKLPAETEGCEAKDIHALREYSAIQLFVERAVGVQPLFRLTRHNAPTVIRICRQLDGIALAIELAAARLNGLPLEEIAAHLHTRFALLSRGNRTAPVRHQTLRGLIDWSYDLLSEAEQRLFRSLAVFAGNWRYAAAQQICDEAETLTLLPSLAAKSLITYREGSEVSRYSMLETVREYALDKLRAEGAEDALRRRHRDWYLALAEQATPHLTGAEQVGWLETLEREHDNLRAAVEWSHITPGEAEAELRLVAALSQFWVMRGYLNEGRIQCEKALARTGSEEFPHARADALFGMGRIVSRQGETEEAQALFTECVRQYREGDDQEKYGTALNALGLTFVAQSDYTAARPHLEESLRVLRSAGHQAGTAAALNSLGLVAWYQGNDAAAQEYHEQSLAIKRGVGNLAGIAFSLTNLGLVAMTRGDYANARRLLRESLVLREEQGDRWGIADTQNYLGMIAFFEGDLPLARRLHQENLERQRALGNKGGTADSLRNLGWVALAEGDSETARRHFVAGLHGEKEIQDIRAITLLLEALAAQAAQAGQPERAARLWGAAKRQRDWMGVPVAANERKDYDRRVAAVQRELGARAFCEKWKQGEAMSLLPAVDYALSEENERG